MVFINFIFLIGKGPYGLLSTAVSFEKKTAVLTNITFWASHALATADRYSALKAKHDMRRVKLTMLPSIFWFLQTPGKWLKKTSHSHVFFLWLGQCKRTASVVFCSPLWWLPILLRILFWPIPPFRSLKRVSPGSFRLLPPFWFWSLLFSWSEILAPGGAQFSLLRRCFCSGTALWQLLLSCPTLVYARRFGGPGIFGA